MEKTYLEYMNEITQDELYKGLLGYGLFTDKLPPVFSSVDFYHYCKNTNLESKVEAHDYVSYESMRHINIPRSMGIPNPFAYQQLCLILSKCWSEILDFFKDKAGSQTYKVSRVHLRKMSGTNKLFKLNYEDWRKDGNPEIDLASGKRYLVKADISNCFPSMYTHALPWALFGKQEAKINRTREEWYNQIDLRARNTTNGETHGILIGPDSSNLLSEIILTAVDHELSDYDFVRAIDDYCCYTSSYEESQRFLVDLSVALREYNLSINHKKTQILELPVATPDHWKNKINSQEFIPANRLMDFKLTRAYLDSAIELSNQDQGNAAILNYAIKTLGGRELTPNAKQYALKTILNLSMLYPYLVSILDKHVLSIYQTEDNFAELVKDFSQHIYHDGLSIHHYEQSSYALFFAIKYDFKIDNFHIKAAIDSGDCIFMVMALLYVEHFDKQDDLEELKHTAEDMSRKDAVTFDQYWPFLYEILPQESLEGEWEKLKREKITFINRKSLTRFNKSTKV